MKQYGLIYSNFQELRSFVLFNNINTNDNVLIQIFTSLVEIEFINILIKEIISIIPHAEIIGTTTAGEIYNGKAISNTTTISFTIFDSINIKTILLNNNNNNNSNNEYESGKIIVSKLVKDDTKVIILFSDGLLTNGYDIAKGIEDANNKVAICGGQAGDNGYLKETLVFTKEGITKKGIVAASLSGKNLNVTTAQSFSWSPIGKQMTITKASNNRIFTIDNIKAIDIYRKYLGDEVANELPISATEFPLIIKKNDSYIARVAFGCNDDGSISFLGNVEVGDEIQFGYGNINMIKEESLKISNSLMNKDIEAIFVYSCSVRKSFIQDNINLEIYSLSNIAPTYGFFTYGEFFTHNHHNEMLNITMTILGLSEGKCSFHTNKTTLSNSQSQNKSFFEGKDLGVIKVFSNLVNQVTNELQKSNEMLEQQKSKIEKMNTVTKSMMEINSKMLTSCEIDSLFQMILDKAFDLIPKGKMGCILVMKDGRLHYKATRGYIEDKINELTYSLDDIFHIFQDSMYNIENLFNPVILDDLEKKLFVSKDTYNLWKKTLIDSPHELLCCGISVDGHIVALIDIFSTNKEDFFNDDDKKLLKYLCYDIAIAIKNAQLLENIFYMSRNDNLTGIYNRHYFRKLLNETLHKSKYFHEPFVICALDLNNFKIINDTYGHDAGDNVLIKFTEIIKIKISEEDIFGRIGGDEFSVIFINKHKKEVEAILDEIYITLKNNVINFNENIEEISFSYGLAEFLDDSEDVESLIKIADVRMYERKRLMKKMQ